MARNFKYVFEDQDEKYFETFFQFFFSWHFISVYISFNFFSSYGAFKSVPDGRRRAVSKRTWSYFSKIWSLRTIEKKSQKKRFYFYFTYHTVEKLDFWVQKSFLKGFILAGIFPVGIFWRDFSKGIFPSGIFSWGDSFLKLRLEFWNEKNIISAVCSFF